MIATKRKLQLDKTTLRALSKGHLSQVVGGIQDTDDLVTAVPCHGNGTTIPQQSKDLPCSEPPPPPPPTSILTGTRTSRTVLAP